MRAPLEPGPSITAEYVPTARHLEAPPGVTKVIARYWQPDNPHCGTRAHSAAAWSADFTVHVRTRFALEQVHVVRPALGSSRATVTSAAETNVAAWEPVLLNPPDATPAPRLPRTHLLPPEVGTRQPQTRSPLLKKTV